LRHSTTTAQHSLIIGHHRARRAIATLAAAAVLVVVAACGSDSATAPHTSTVAGDWTLQSVDGKAPPDTVIHTSTLTVEFLDGTLALNEDMSYKLFFHSRTTQGDSVTADSSGSTGTYTQSGNTVTIHNPANNGDVVATVASSSLSFVDNGLTFMFTKSTP
jgi:hypothetical protein